MSIVIFFIALQSSVVTVPTEVIHALRLLWAYLPAINLVLHVIGAVITIAAGIRTLCRRCCRHCNCQNDAGSNDRQ